MNPIYVFFNLRTCRVPPARPLFLTLERAESLLHVKRQRMLERAGCLLHVQALNGAWKRRMNSVRLWSIFTQRLKLRSKNGPSLRKASSYVNWVLTLSQFEGSLKVCTRFASGQPNSTMMNSSCLDMQNTLI